MTWDEVDQKMQAIDLSAHQGAAVAAIPTQAQVCSIYKVAKPMLTFASTLGLIPLKWRQVLLALTAALDKLCP